MGGRRQPLEAAAEETAQDAEAVGSAGQPRCSPPESRLTQRLEASAYQITGVLFTLDLGLIHHSHSQVYPIELVDLQRCQNLSLQVGFMALEERVCHLAEEPVLLQDLHRLSLQFPVNALLEGHIGGGVL